jgi:hypothetical protein
MKNEDQISLDENYQQIRDRIPQLAISSMMEGRPDHIDRQTYLKITLDNLSGIKWQGAIKIELPLDKLAVLHSIYKPWFETTDEIQKFIPSFKATVLEGTPLPQEFSFLQLDINKNYVCDVDLMMDKRPLIVLRSQDLYSIIDGNHRFWGKVAKELKLNNNIQSVTVIAYVGDI